MTISPELLERMYQFAAEQRELIPEPQPRVWMDGDVLYATIPLSWADTYRMREVDPMVIESSD